MITTCKSIICGQKHLILPAKNDLVKRHLFNALLTICLLFAEFQANACDVCGCSMGGTNLGILPQFHKNFIGLHYFYRGFSSEHTILGSDTKSISQESFQTTELRGRFRLSERIQLFTLVPINFNQQKENNITSTFSGIGDITVFANYSIYNNGDSLDRKWKHNLQLGGGIKTPIGSYKKLDKNNILNPNVQTGSGSFDFLLDAIYTIRYKKWGLNNTAFYRYNTTNSNDYKFGNRFTLSSSFFYWANIKGYSLLPSIGINYDLADNDVHNKFTVDHSGGNLLFTTFGLDFYYKKFTFGINYQLPVYQDSPITKGNSKIGATLLYNF